MNENYVFIDANVFDYPDSNQLIKLLHRIKSKNLKLIMTKKLFDEIHNLPNKHTQNNYIPKFLEYVTWIDVDKSLVKKSQLIPIHFPDNQHIAVAKQKNAVVISNDNDMIRVALEQGLDSTTLLNVYTMLGKFENRQKCTCKYCRKAGKIKLPSPKLFRLGNRFYKISDLKIAQ